MNTKHTLFFSILFSLFFSISMISCGSEEGHSHADAYQCPMQCEGDKTYAEKGKCPVCEMDLELISNPDNADSVMQDLEEVAPALLH